VNLQSDGPYRQLFINLLKELKQIANVADYRLPDSFLEDNLRILNSLSADFTASLQKDLEHKRPDERNELFFDVIRLAEHHGLELPNYLRIAKFFESHLHTTH
jgi:2-dehydropantoate 2-reductase